jgi:rubrerythrin
MSQLWPGYDSRAMNSSQKKEGNEVEKTKQMECALCGYKAPGKFTDDICPHCGLTYFKCQNCGYTITAAAAPKVCPSCHERCDFLNITCYTPECGGPGHIDPRL